MADEYILADEICVACGTPVPEGQMLCSNCIRIAYPERYDGIGTWVELACAEKGHDEPKNKDKEFER